MPCAGASRTRHRSATMRHRSIRCAVPGNPSMSARRLRATPHPLAVAVLALLPLVAAAQTTPAATEAAAPQTDQPADAQERAATLDTVQVTAQRRVENIQDVPVSISTVSGEKLDTLASGGTDIRFLSGRVPSLNIESSFGRAFPRFYVRGYGNTDRSEARRVGK